MASEKQLKWRKRAFLLMRLAGLYFNGYENVITEKEKAQLNAIHKLRKDMLDHFQANSVKLGFKVKTPRPYASKEEFLKAQEEHGPKIQILGKLYSPSKIADDHIKIRGENTPYWLLTDYGFYKWQDGTYCRIDKD